MGPELFDIITSRMQFNINIKNIKIYYEDNETLANLSNRSSSNFSMCFSLSELTLLSVDFKANKSKTLTSVLIRQVTSKTCSTSTSLWLLFLARLTSFTSTI